MQAYLNDSKIRERFLTKDGSGCSIHDVLRDEKECRRRFEEDLGIPVIFILIVDHIWNELPDELAKEFPLLVMSSISAGQDFSKVLHRLILSLLVDEEVGPLKHVKEGFQTYVIQNIINTYKRYVDGGEVNISLWKAAADIDWLDQSNYSVNDTVAMSLAYLAATTLPILTDIYCIYYRFINIIKTISYLNRLCIGGIHTNRQYKQFNEQLYIKVSKKLIDIIRADNTSVKDFLNHI